MELQNEQKAKVKLIEVGGSTCGVCKMLQPMVDKVITMFNKDELEYEYVYGDTDEGKAIMEENSIGAISKVPTFIFIVDGEEKERFDGGITLTGLRDKIKNYL
ncbi:MAG: thioredoxin family protein [Paludibacteraceae bacterium]|nr:thioredoxin family protein [Paludibacteraceae bacterium]